MKIAANAPHVAKWVLNKRESVFGLKRVNAVLECFICGKRLSPRILPLTDFNVSGKEILTYTLQEGICPKEQH